MKHAMFSRISSNHFGTVLLQHVMSTLELQLSEFLEMDAKEVQRLPYPDFHRSRWWLLAISIPKLPFLNKCTYNSRSSKSGREPIVHCFCLMPELFSFKYLFCGQWKVWSTSASRHSYFFFYNKCYCRKVTFTLASKSHFRGGSRWHLVSLCGCPLDPCRANAEMSIILRLWIKGLSCLLCYYPFEY